MERKEAGKVSFVGKPVTTLEPGPQSHRDLEKAAESMPFGL